MDDIMDRLIGVDKKNEIFNLWYEINFLRLVLNEILVLNPTLHENLTDEIITKAREQSREIVTKRFPHCKITFNEEPIDESKQEQTCCTHPDSLEQPPVSPHP
jgi:hypothetical protein